MVLEPFGARHTMVLWGSGTALGDAWGDPVVPGIMLGLYPKTVSLPSSIFFMKKENGIKSLLKWLFIYVFYKNLTGCSKTYFLKADSDFIYDHIDHQVSSCRWQLVINFPVTFKGVQWPYVR